MKKTDLTARIPDAELDIMLILWENETEDGYAPSKIIDVYNGMKEVRPLTRSAIHSLLERLAERGFVRIDLVDAAVPYKLLMPLVSEADYRRTESDNFVKKLCRGNARTLLATLIDTGKITDDDMEEMAALLKARRKGEQ